MNVKFCSRRANFVIDKITKQMYILSGCKLYVFNDFKAIDQMDEVTASFAKDGFEIVTGTARLVDKNGVMSLIVRKPRVLSRSMATPLRTKYGIRVGGSRETKASPRANLDHCINCGVWIEPNELGSFRQYFCTWRCLCEFVRGHKDEIKERLKCLYSSN